VETLALAMQLSLSRPVVYRDPKPANFLCSEPFLVLTQLRSLAEFCSIQTAATLCFLAVARL
jgi:hypothetical protein